MSRFKLNDKIENVEQDTRRNDIQTEINKITTNKRSRFDPVQIRRSESPMRERG
jgi:hypothetical protein